jgi:beta-lactamase superfamily II metal-dependent hydrolase
MYLGFEVFFLFLDNADCILVRHYSINGKTVILIDGGSTQDTPVVRKFLNDQGESRLNHLVCSHPHLDHGGGLIELVKDNSLSIDRAWLHVGDLLADRINSSKYWACSSLLKRAQAAKETQRNLVAALLARKIPIEEPFAFNWIGPLQIVSPTLEFYNAQLDRIRSDDIVEMLNERYKQRDNRAMLESIFGKEPEAPLVEETEELGGEATSPANEVSTVLYLPFTQLDNTKKHFLLTADAGTEALSQLVQASARANHLLFKLDWMQLPHHGSRRNMNVDLINYFCPRSAFVSAEGTKKHPSVKLVNAVKNAGGAVYSTHYKPPKNKGYWLRQTCGTVPPLNATPATSLWN